MIPIPPAPVIVGTGDDINAYLKPKVEPGTFVMESVVLRTLGKETTSSITLVPFYKMHFQRYAVYWNTFSKEEWGAIKTEYEAEQAHLRALEARTINAIRLGEIQPEREHNFESEPSRAGDTKYRRWRRTWCGSWFAFDLKVSEGPLELLCTYWGGGRDRAFEILVEDVKIASVMAATDAPEAYVDAVYPLPAGILVGKEKVRVKVQPVEGKRSARIASFRIIRPIK